MCPHIPLGHQTLSSAIKLSSPFSHFELIPGNILRRNNTCQWLIQQWLMLNKIDWVPCAVHTAFSIFTPTLTVWPQNIISVISIRNRLVLGGYDAKGRIAISILCVQKLITTDKKTYVIWIFNCVLTNITD